MASYATAKKQPTNTVFDQDLVDLMNSGMLTRYTKAMITGDFGGLIQSGTGSRLDDPVERKAQKKPRKKKKVTEEVIDLTDSIIDNDEITIEELIEDNGESLDESKMQEIKETALYYMLMLKLYTVPLLNVNV
jgi:hypothetical protein